MAAKSKAPNKRGRDAETGEFITIAEAKRRPKTTTIETIPSPKPKKPGPKKPPKK